MRAKLFTSLVGLLMAAGALSESGLRCRCNDPAQVAERKECVAFCTQLNREPSSGPENACAAAQCTYTENGCETSQEEHKHCCQWRPGVGCSKNL